MGTIRCPECGFKVDTDECLANKFWKEDENGVENHLMSYQCPNCGHWIDEDEL